MRTVPESIHRDICHASRIRDFNESHDGKTYRATVRHFGASVEASIRLPGLKELQRSFDGANVPPSLLVPQVRSEAEQECRNAENRRRAAHRAKQAVRWLLKAMGADHLLTLTFRENVTDIARVQRVFQRFTRLMRLRYPEWRYVACRELQERGAWHLHLGIRGRGDVHWIRRCWWVALGHRVEIVYDQDGKKHLRATQWDKTEWRESRSDEIRGNIDLRGPSRRFGGDGRRWKTEKLAAYMTKYMAKAFGEIETGRRYWPSKGIQKPEPNKFWLASANFDDAVREVHAMMRNRYGCSELHIWSSDDMTRIWFSGSGIVPTF